MTSTEHTEPDTTGPAGAAESHAAALEEAAAGEHTPANDEAGEGDSAPPTADESKASKLRARAQAAEAARDMLAAQLAATRQSIIDSQLVAAGFDNDRLRTAAGIDVESVLTDDGEIDAGKLASAIEEAAEDLGVRAPARRPIPNPLVGLGQGGRRSESGREAWDSAFGR